jgi:hypothetical protein
MELMKGDLLSYRRRKAAGPGASMPALDRYKEKH